MKKVLILLIMCLSLEAKNLVILDPASIEIIYLLGAESDIKGIASLQQSNIYPEEKTKLLESVGSFSNPSIEKIIALKPDLVILSSYSLNLEERLDKLGIKTLYLKAERLDDIIKNVKTLGEIVDKKSEAQKIIDEFSEEIARFKEAPLNKKVVFLFASNPLTAFGKETIINDILELLGLSVITGDSDATRPILSQEFIAQNNPDIILFGLRISDKTEILKDNALLKHTNAAKNDKILHIKPYPLLRASPLIINHIKNLRESLN